MVAVISSFGGSGERRSPASGPRVARAAGGKAPAAPPSALDQLVAPNRRLAAGATGDPVRRLQQTLTVLGASPGGIDGIFSDGTRSAVESFQTANNLTPTGAVDPATAAALRRGLTRWADARSATIRQGLDDAVAAGRLPAREAARDRRILLDGVLALVRLDSSRAALLSTVLADVSAQAPVYDGSRAQALFGMLDVNAHRLATGTLPTTSGEDIVGPDGTVYRFIAREGYQFHPLANFARLNRYVTRHRLGRARRLAAALRARAIDSAGTQVWEYYFPFGGPSRWTSALAQSAAAQALMRAGAVLHDTATSAAAKAAFAAIPGRLARPLGGGQWVREYSWSDIAILNAQLQSIVSLSAYGAAAGDARATTFVQQLSRAALAELPSLDTGTWSRYSIAGSPASVHYHCYHVSLLRRLADANPGVAQWREYAQRWQGYADARGGCAGS